MIKSIETNYKGYRFRSRLEARWAVCLDTLGVKWEYERQGYEVTDRLGLLCCETWNYLPDFWLPEFDLHAEVKGSLDGGEVLRLLSAAAHLSSPSGGCGGGNDMVILGPIPQADRRSAWPYRIHMHKGDLQASPFWFSYQKFDCYSHRGVTSDGVIADDTGMLHEYTPELAERLLAGYPDKIGDHAAAAYRAARSARFEHGENGAAQLAERS